ncbi:low affinity immunoglobulin gamma Fc region receptor III-like [Zonotrichia albicollis]|uniref:low affinity immunoglobulin gamma Fc region receptor III-like n=1 Tax=Zonotrichia albicollis TaxID=44394 RepID=UPI003D80E70B
MAGDTGMARKVVLLLWAQTLGLAGTQTTWIIVEPPWMPAVLWDRVTLTCQGLGTTSATTWYKDGRRWGQQGHDRLTVTENGTYECNRTGSGLSPPMRVLDDWLVLQVPARPLLEGDTVTLRCRDQWNKLITWVSFYHEEKQLVELRNGTELILFPLKLQHGGHYRCRGWLKDRQWVVSAPVTVTVHAVAVNVGRTLLFLLLLLAVFGGCHCWHHHGSPGRKGQCWTPQIVGTEWADGPPWVSPSPAPPRDPQVTNAELSGPNEGQRDPCDYDDML